MQTFDYVEAFVLKCQTNDADNLRDLFDYLGCLGQREDAFRALVKVKPVVKSHFRRAFMDVWVECKMISLSINDHRLLCDAARLLLPPYSGPPVRLFRGAGALERRRRNYGLSWSASKSAAENFALGRRGMPGGSVLLETLAPPEAIICKIKYWMTKQEIAKLRQAHPDIEIPERYHEREFVVDRRFLKSVTVLRKYKPDQVSQI